MLCHFASKGSSGPRVEAFWGNLIWQSVGVVVMEIWSEQPPAISITETKRRAGESTTVTRSSVLRNAIAQLADETLSRVSVWKPGGMKRWWPTNKCYEAVTLFWLLAVLCRKRTYEVNIRATFHSCWAQLCCDLNASSACKQVCLLSEFNEIAANRFLMPLNINLSELVKTSIFQVMVMTQITKNIYFFSFKWIIYYRTHNLKT